MFSDVSSCFTLSHERLEIMETDTFGWKHDSITECDRCHMERKCCQVDFWDGSGDWDYCKSCWRKLSEAGAFENHWV